MKGIVAGVVMAFLALPAWASTPPGVKHTFFRETDHGPLNAHLITVDLNHPQVQLSLGLARDQVNKAETVHGIARRSGAVAAINGSFFQFGASGPQAVGITMVDGQVISDSRHRRTAVGFTPDNRVVIGVPRVATIVSFPEAGRTVRLDGVNHARGHHQTVLYTKHFGPYTRTNEWGREMVIRNGRIVRYSYGNTLIPADGAVLSFHGADAGIAQKFPVGSRVEIEHLKTGEWRDVETIVTAGPMLLQKGKVELSLSRDRFRYDVLRPAARSAIGVTHNNKLLLLTVNPVKEGGGITYTKLATVLRRLGAVEAIGLDGGGSSTLYVSGKVINKGPFSHLRPVSNALLVLFRR